jgi:hypothetical protein
MAGIIYLLHEREFIKSNVHIYKIGKTQNVKGRLGGYPKHSRLMFSMFTTRLDTMETELIAILTDKFQHRQDIGKEYFEGNPFEMMMIIVTYLGDHNRYDEIIPISEKEEISMKINNANNDQTRILCEYVNQKRENLSSCIIKSTSFFDDISHWMITNNYKTKLTMSKLHKDLSELYGVIKTNHKFEDCVDIALNFPDLYQPIQPLPQHDHTISVMNFIDANRVTFNNKIIKSKEVFDQMLVWFNERGINTRITFNKMIAIITKSFSVTNKPQMFDDGVADALLFPSLVLCEDQNISMTDEEKIKRFIEEYIVKDSTSFMTLKSVKEVFVNSRYFYGKIQMIKSYLEDILKTICIEEKKINGIKYRNVFLGYKLNAPCLD